MAIESHGNDLVRVVALLAAGVVAVPVFRRLGLGSVLGYLAAGLAIGPFGLRLFTDPQAILHVAELGVVLFLFVIGLEMQPSRLWKLRGEIFGLGAAQVAGCGLLLDAGVLAAGLRAGGRVLRRDGLRALLHRDRGADPGGARRRGDAARPAHRFHPAAGGPRHRAAARPGGVPRARRRRRRALAGDRPRPGLARGAGGRRQVSAQPAVPRPRRCESARSDDRRRVAGGAGRGPADAARRPVDGDGRVPRRRAAVRIHLPPPAGGRRRTVPRHPARAVLHRRGHVARPFGIRARLAADPRRHRGADAAQVGGRLHRGAPDLRQAPGEPVPRRAARAGRRVRLRALRGGGGGRDLRAAPERAAHGDDHRVHGAHAVRRVRAALADAQGRAVDGWRRGGQAAWAAACWSSASAASARWRASRCSRAASTWRSSIRTPT